MLPASAITRDEQLGLVSALLVAKAPEHVQTREQKAQALPRP